MDIKIDELKITVDLKTLLILSKLALVEKNI
jgi:hypothetical protein